jgi:Flp pilus assembly pilin Flp
LRRGLLRSWITDAIVSRLIWISREFASERKHVIELSERSTKGGTGRTAIECGLIVAGISVTIIIGVHVFGSQLKTIYSRVASQLLPSSAVDVTGTIGASEVSSSWDRQGITRIIVGQSETISAWKYGIPVPTNTKANASIRGQLRRASAMQSLLRQLRRPLCHCLPQRRYRGRPCYHFRRVHVVASGDTLSKIARKYRVPLKTRIVANGIQPETILMVGTKLAIPTKRATAPVAKSKPVKVGQAL